MPEEERSGCIEKTQDIKLRMENIKRHAAELNPTNVSGGNFGAAQTDGAGGGPGDPGGRRQDGVNKAKLEVSLCI